MIGNNKSFLDFPVVRKCILLSNPNNVCHENVHKILKIWLISTLL